MEDLVAGYGQVIVDECHHLPAVSFERVLAEAKARYVVGLTATPQRRDGHHPITEMQLGPVRFSVDSKSQTAQRPFEHHLVVRETTFKPPDGATDLSIQGRFARHLVVLQGGMNAKERREVTARLAAIPDNEERLVLATGRYIGEGFDDARLDTLFLALPVSWKGTLIQYTGRLHRLHPRKTVVRIFDYVDRDVRMLLRMFERRLRGYRAIGYARGEAPLGLAERNDEIVVEYDEDVLRSLEVADAFS